MGETVGFNKRTDLEKTRDRQIIAELHLKGFSLREIPEILRIKTGANYTLSHQMINNDLQKVKNLWSKKTEKRVVMAKDEELFKIDLMEKEAWLAWEESKKEAVSRSIKKKLKQQIAQVNPSLPLPEDNETRVETKAQTGNVQYMHIIQWCVERRLELLGIKQLLKFSITGEISKIGGGEKTLEELEKELAEIGRQLRPNNNKMLTGKTDEIEEATVVDTDSE